MEEKRYLTVQSDYHKVQVPVSEIMYVTIEGRKVKLSLRDGSAVRTNKSLKTIFAALPAEEFSSINRGIVIARSYVKNERAGLITMTDGTQFRRRVRSDRLKEQGNVLPAARNSAWRECPAEELDWWLGGLTMPFCILELVYQSRGASADFVVRYCNRAMEQLGGVRFTEVKGQPVTALRGIGSPKWTSIFADVAINGGERIIEDMWDDKFYRIHCYQPHRGCCALAMTDLTREHNLVQTVFQRRKK